MYVSVVYDRLNALGALLSACCSLIESRFLASRTQQQINIPSCATRASIRNDNNCICTVMDETVWRRAFFAGGKKRFGRVRKYAS